MSVQGLTVSVAPPLPASVTQFRAVSRIHGSSHPALSVLYTSQFSAFERLLLRVQGASQVAQWQRTCLPMWETQETQVRSLGQKDPFQEGMATHLVFLLGETHGQRLTGGYNPQGWKESDPTEAT